MKTIDFAGAMVVGSWLTGLVWLIILLIAKFCALSETGIHTLKRTREMISGRRLDIEEAVARQELARQYPDIIFKYFDESEESLRAKIDGKKRFISAGSAKEAKLMAAEFGIRECNPFIPDIHGGRVSEPLEFPYR